MKHRTLSVGTLLFCSGFCALVFQVAWVREFRLVFGGSTAASGAVLAIFMGGLGLGNALLGNRADRQANALGYYGTLEFWIGISAAASPWLIDGIRAIYLALGGRTSLGLTGATCTRLALSIVVLGMPTFLMGGTLPAASKAVTTESDASRRGIALLYAMNTLGAVAGALASTFLLLEHFGTRSTLWLVCGVNVCIGLVARKLSRRPESASTSPTAPPRRAAEQAARKRKPGAAKSRPHAEPIVLPASLVYFAAAVVGFAFFLIELVWFRMLGPLLGGTTFTFGLILAIALLGIGLGGGAYSVIFRGLGRGAEPTPIGFALTCGLEAVCLAYPFAMGDQIALLAASFRDQAGASFSDVILGWGAVAMLVVFPASFVSGVQFPLLIALLGQGDRDVGKQVGLAFAANTAGAILGSLGGGFGILPYLTAPGTWIAVVVLLCLLGTVVLLAVVRAGGLSRSMSLPLCACMAALLLTTARGPTAVWRHTMISLGKTTPNELQERLNFYRRRVLWEAEGKESSIAIIAADGLAFISNSKSDGNSIADAGTQIMGGLIGALLHPEPKTCFVVGLGTGETAGWLAEVQSMTDVSVVELEPEVDEMARRCASINANVLKHPKVHRIYDDAREVLLTSPLRYDLIVSEPSNPYRVGVANLYTQEYYRAARDRLNPGGFFAQWLQMYAVDEQTVRTVVTTLRSVFPHVEVWETEPNDSLFVCSLEPIHHSVSELRARIGREPFRSALLEAWRTTNPEGALAHYVAGTSVIEEWNRTNKRPCNTDDRNLVEYGFARTVGRTSEFSLAELRDAASRMGSSLPQLAGGEIDPARIGDQFLVASLLSGGKEPAGRKYSAAQRARAEAILSSVTGDPKSAVRLWKTQPRDPEDPLELALLALAYADLGDARMQPLVDRLADLEPAEAAAIEALFHYRQGELEQSVDALERAFASLHEDPWAHSSAIEHIFRLASEISGRDATQAAKLYAALDRPFALYRLEEQRRRTAVFVGVVASPADGVRAIEALEPNVPWDESFLELRAKTYAAGRHRLAAQAQQDLAQYRHNQQRSERGR